MVKRYSNSSVFLAAFICVILFYSGLVKVYNKNRFICFIQPQQINCLQGSLISSPVKTGDGNYYYSRFKVNQVQSKNGVNCGAAGNIQIYIPVEQAEALLPGKLYSGARLKDQEKAHLWEAGGVSGSPVWQGPSCLCSVYRNL